MFFKQNLCPLLSRIERRTPTAEITPDFMRGLCNKTEYVPVAQLDRVTDSDSVGRRFESFQARQQRDAAPDIAHQKCGGRYFYAQKSDSIVNISHVKGSMQRMEFFVCIFEGNELIYDNNRDRTADLLNAILVQKLMYLNLNQLLDSYIPQKIQDQIIRSDNPA